MRQRKIPDREGLELGIASGGTVLMLVIQLRQAGGKLARARAGCRHDNERTRGLDKLVLAVAFVRNNQIDIVRIALDGIMQLGGNTERVQTIAEDIGSGLTGILRDDHGGNGKSIPSEQIDQAQDVFIIGNTQVATGLVLLDMVRIDCNDDLDVIGDALEHAKLAVRLKARQHAAGMIVIEQLAAKLQIQLAAKLRDALLNMSSLQLDILRIVETLAHVWLPSRFPIKFLRDYSEACPSQRPGQQRAPTKHATTQP